ncbi:MAG TPA: diversity-generating retroelement protein Avd [Patescibacteria group bacterium]|nr:diversity-generating retroelement protein Avd [Patescibacteria group bacterium]
MQSNTTEIIIIQKTYKLYLSLHATIVKIPKISRFSLGARIETIALDILEKLYEASAKHGNARLMILEQMDTKLKILQTLIRALYDMKDINDKKFLDLSESAIEIGRMLGGWIKTAKSK